MGVLDGLKPERVFYYFEKICGIPHGSYNVKGISDYIVNTARSFDLEVRQDDEYNVVIKKPASEGYGPAKTLMIQGHMDMVCVKDPGVDIDMARDGIRLVVEDGFVHADHTTLGGDDGIAVAMGLAILEDDSIAHPDLEVVFTTQEEVGMEGATALDASDLKASYLLNLDSETEGHFLAGCAGGATVTCALPVSRTGSQGRLYRIEITGLQGGHSGSNIHMGRANANILLGRFLHGLATETDYYIRSVSGGEKDNAIPLYSCAEIVSDADPDKIMSFAEKFEQTMRTEYRVSDPGVRINVSGGEKGRYELMIPSLADKIIFMLMDVPNGVQEMSMDVPGLVETSLNLGIMRTNDDSVSFSWAVRSSVRSRKTLLIDKLDLMAKRLGGSISISGDYPEWSYDPDSKICALSGRLYEELTGRRAVTETIHAGVECGLLGEKLPGLDMVSIGPDIIDIHTSNEHLSIASVERCYELVLAVLREFKNYCN